MQYIPNDLKKLIESESDAAFYLANISVGDFIKDIKSILTKIEIPQKIPKRSLEDRKSDFIKELTPFLPIYGKDMLNEFYKYWSESNRSKTKMKWEREDTWELKLRLERWANNGFNNKKSPEQTQIILKDTHMRGGWKPNLMSKSCQA